MRDVIINDMKYKKYNLPNSIFYILLDQWAF